MVEGLGAAHYYPSTTLRVVPLPGKAREELSGQHLGELIAGYGPRIFTNVHARGVASTEGAPKGISDDRKSRRRKTSRGKPRLRTGYAAAIASAIRRRLFSTP